MTVVSHVCIMSLLIAAGTALAQQPAPQPESDKPAPEAQPQPESQPESKPAPGGGEALPSLDDLLGTVSEAPATPESGKDDLDQKLKGVEVSDAFRRAVNLMGQASTRLGAKDRGLATQRLQEDAVRKLDELITAQQKQSKSSPNKKPQPDESSPSPGSKPSSSSASQPQQGENNAEVDPPPRRDGQLNPEVAAARAAWGALPARVRDTLMQGSQDRFSSMYERLTQDYYRRLAEESRKP
ncbi:MAG: hypothetical protein H7Y88_05100 [Phycisphaerales bacterium]|nr:hypothetical protein [Phycisphaerales bacterium]